MVAGGSGRRFGSAKQFESIGARRVLDVSRETADVCSDGVVVVVPEADAEREGGVAGGATRSESVRNGLAAVPAEADFVLVHDAARPLATPAVYERVIAALEAGADAVIPAVAVTDTIKVLGPASDAERDAGVLGTVETTPDRASLVAVQTPQGFRADALRAAHASGADATDDAALVEAAGGRVVVVDGDAVNRKITDPDDLEWARRVLGERAHTEAAS